MEAAAEVDDVGEEGGEFVDRDLATAADIDVRLGRVALHQEDHRVGKVIEEEEATRRSWRWRS
jgi:hypothetical protein